MVNQPPYVIPKRRTVDMNGKPVYLLGVSHNGVHYWLAEPTWDCEWYWGLGYVRTFTCDRNPKFSHDIRSHEHFDSKFLQQPKCAKDVWDEFFEYSTLTSKETWQLLELMETMYRARSWSDTLHRGGANYTQNPLGKLIQNQQEYQRINQTVIPTLWRSVAALLAP